MKIKFETKVKILQIVGVILTIIGTILGIVVMVYAIITKVSPIQMSILTIILIMSGVTIIENAYNWIK